VFLDLEASMRKVVLALLGAAAIGISAVSAAAAQSGTATTAVRIHSSKGHFSPVPGLKRSKAGVDRPSKIDPRFEQMRDPCTVEG
jgi:hypothetical protein